MAWIRKKERLAMEAEGKNYYEKQCLICGKTFIPKDKNANQRTCCYDCMPEGHQLQRGEFLAKIKQQRGGKCQRCGYNRCLKALEFHHLDPTKKDFTISNDHFNRMVYNYIGGIDKYSESNKRLAFFSYIAGGFGTNIDKQINAIVF